MHDDVVVVVVVIVVQINPERKTKTKRNNINKTHLPYTLLLALEAEQERIFASLMEEIKGTRAKIPPQKTWVLGRERNG